MSSDDHSAEKDVSAEAGDLQRLEFLDQQPARQQQLESRLAELEPEAWQQVGEQPPLLQNATIITGSCCHTKF